MSGVLAGESFSGGITFDIPDFKGAGYYCWISAGAQCGGTDRLAEVDVSFNFLGTEFTELNFNTAESAPGVIVDESGHLLELLWRADFDFSMQPVGDGSNFFKFTSLPFLDQNGNSVSFYRLEYILDDVNPPYPFGSGGIGSIDTNLRNTPGVPEPSMVGALFLFTAVGWRSLRRQSEKV